MTAALKQATQIKIQMNVVKGPHAGQSFLFYKTPLTIGRGPENDIVLVNDPMVSRNHARIDLNQNVFELTNLSGKNIIYVHGEAVNKSALLNDAIFLIGDSEFKFQFDLGQAVVAVPPKVNLVPNSAPHVSVVKTAVTKVPQTTPAIKNNTVQSRSTAQAAPVQQRQQVNYSQAYGQTTPLPLKANSNHLRSYLIIAIIAGALAYFLMPTPKAKAPKAKPILKYEDDIAVSLKSKLEVDSARKRKDDKEAKNSPQAQRSEENFIKGMRDFQLGNYARALDFFQVVLNLNPDHALARRHLYLSKVRFDELVQVKLMLGESYYQKHNFSMCESLYRQVMNMLQGKSNDQKFQLAQKMTEKCQLASEGIR